MGPLTTRHTQKHAFSHLTSSVLNLAWATHKNFLREGSMQIEKQACYMASDSTTKSKICKPNLLVPYLWDECVDVCLHQTGSLKQQANRVGQEHISEQDKFWGRQYPLKCWSQTGLNWLKMHPWATASCMHPANADEALPMKSRTPCSPTGSQPQLLLCPLPGAGTSGSTAI